MNIPVHPFAKGGLGGIGFLPPLQYRLSIPCPPGNPPCPLLQRGLNILGNSLSPMLKSTLSRKTWIAWVIFAIGLLVTVFTSLQVKQDIEQERLRQFAFVCDQVTLKIQDRLEAYALILRGAVALFAASKSVEREEWQAFVGNLRAWQSVPGAQGIGFTQLIPENRLAAHIAQIRSEGFPSYTVHPSGKRALYTSIIYLEPFRDLNLRALGYDMYTDPVSRAAMERSCDTGEAALSGKIKLMQETETEVQAVTLMYAPVYRHGASGETIAGRWAALIGWVYSPIRMSDLMAGILGQWESSIGKTVDLKIYDGREATPASQLFESKPANLGDVHSLFQQQRTVGINGRQWLLVFDLSPTVSAIDYASAWSTAVGGFALSGMLLGLMLSIINTRNFASRIADKLTEASRRRGEALQESEEKTRLLLDSTAEAIYGIDMNGDCTFCNNACIRLLGYRHPKELLGKNMHWQIHGKHADGTLFPVEECRIFQALKKGEPMHVDNEVLWRADDTFFPAEYWSYPQTRNGVVVGAVVSFLDITEHRNAEQAKLDDSENRYRSIFQGSPDGIIIADAENKMITFANSAACQMFGYSEEQLTMMSIANLHPEDTLQDALASFEKQARGDMPLAQNIQCVRKNGEYFYADFVAKGGEGHLCIEIHDTGIGISKEKLPQIFQPFSSGWDDGDGTGLGLATSLGIIETHGGIMWVESEGIGKGSTFTILLPYKDLSQEEVEKDQAISNRSPLPRSANAVELAPPPSGGGVKGRGDSVTSVNKMEA